MKECIPHVSEKVIMTISSALKSLMGKRPRFGLPAPVKRYEIAHDGTCWHGKRIHFWIIVCGNKIGLRIFEHPSRPKRKALQNLLAVNEPPTLCVYEYMTPEKIVHKLAQCIKTGLNRMRHGLIGILKPQRDKGLIRRCDTGSVYAHPFTPSLRQC
ncbi:MAG: hypothetical protein AAB365_00130 [Patescibacteria group bacterium]